MSELHSLFPPDHEVFKGGRYLEAFACLEDIDHFELSILQYLGNKMPFDKGFIGEVAFPSVATISQNTKIPESTVRKKTKQLVSKGYIIKTERKMMNERGHWQQSSNDYYLTNLAFEKFQAVQESRLQIACDRRRAVGQSELYQPSPITEQSPPPQETEAGPCTHESNPPRLVATNSPSKSPDEYPIDSQDSSGARTTETRKQEAFRLIVNWEEIVKRPVSVFERRRFVQQYIKTRSTEPYLLEKIAQIEADPYLFERAKSINFLYGGVDMALKNKIKMEKTVRHAFSIASSEEDLKRLEGQLPDFLSDSSRDFASPTPELINRLFGSEITAAKRRLGSSKLPENLGQLLSVIQEKLKVPMTTKIKARFESLQELAPLIGFSEALKSYENCLKGLEVPHD